MKCYSIQYEQKGYYIASHSLVNAIQCFCDFTSIDFMKLPAYGVAVERVSNSLAKKVMLENPPMLFEVSLSSVIKNRTTPGVVATYIPIAIEKIDPAYN